MLKRKYGFGLVAMLLAIALVLSGCNSKDKSPKDALQASLTTSSELNSYTFKGNMKFEEFDLALAEMTEDDTMTMNMFKNAELSWTGAYKKDPMLAEVILKLELKGDMAINFTIPIIVSEKKLWVKVPNAAMLPIPEELVGKYLELDMDQLAEQAGQEIPTIDPALSQDFVKDLVDIVFKHIEADDYLSNVKAKDAGIPDDVDVKQVVQAHVEKSQIEPLLKTIIEKIAPEVLDLLESNDKYREVAGLTAEEITAAKDALKEADTSELDAGLAEMKEQLKSLNIVSNIGIDKKDYPVYTDATLKAAFDVDGDSGSFAIKVVSQLSDVNEEVKFEVGEPDASEVIPFEEAFGDLGSLMGGVGLDESL
ncbi:hypothetical protein [Cohnella sp. GCM10027633]|uniref:hypothetical protein n=1 Tax=unclassified Cohnella TaxID=2636738 RepID=UPI00363F1375